MAPESMNDYLQTHTWHSYWNREFALWFLFGLGCVFMALYITACVLSAWAKTRAIRITNERLADHKVTPDLAHDAHMRQFWNRK